MAASKVPLILGLFGLLCSGPLSAEGSWAADLAWPTVAPGAWTPLVGSAPAQVSDWTLEVRVVSVAGRESLPVEYHQAAGGEFEVPVFVDDGARELLAAFVVNGVTVEQRRIPLADRLFPGHLIGADGLRIADRAALADLLLPQEPVRVMPLSPSLWPTSALTFGGLSALVLSDPGPILSPAQVRAARAWIASGGQLVVIGSLEAPASLVGQIGPVTGLGRVTTLPSAPAEWHSVLPLRPYGQVRPWGSDFDPPPRDLSGEENTAPTAAIVLIVVWAAVGALVLVLQRKGGSRLPLAWAALGTIAVLVLGNTGSLSWDGGLIVHGREVVLPGEYGRFVLLEVRQPSGRAGFLGWPAASPWALARWQAAFHDPEAVPRSQSASRALYASFAPSVTRQAQYAVTWTGIARWSDRQGALWSDRETVPEALNADAPWLFRLAASAPGTRWQVGIEGTTCWAMPEWGGRP